MSSNIQLQAPVVSKKLTQQSLRTMEMTEDGLTVAVGADGGEVHLVQMSQNLAEVGKMEKINMGGMFEREMRRERILEARNKGKKFKDKMGGKVCIIIIK